MHRLPLPPNYLRKTGVNAYLWVDALSQRCREGGRVVNVCTAIATGVNAEGHREILGVDVFKGIEKGVRTSGWSPRARQVRRLDALGELMLMKVFLGPGATGGVSSLKPYVDGLAARGIAAQPVQLPGGNAERAVLVYLEQSGDGPDVVVGGRSYGGRVASLAAAAGHEFAGLLLFAYPLHRPGFPEQLRTEHWPRIRCPVLIVQGESDPFGSPEELRREARRLREVRVVTLPGTGHALKERLQEALSAAADWIAALG